jgi:2'-deoxynucleoside 5'-phosphate N-hydrolase
MKIYFAGSIRGGRSDAAVYAVLIAYLRTFGEVLTEHVGNPALTEKGDDGPNDRYIHDRDMRWLDACDLVVAEVSVPSLGVGYELGWASALKKPVFCLYRPAPDRSLSAMIAGSPGLEIAVYSSIEEAQILLYRCIQKTAEHIGVSIGEAPSITDGTDGFDDDAA